MHNVKAIQKINEAELRLGSDSKSSWHDEYRDSAYIFIGGLDYNLTEGDILSVFSQYGEVVNINLVRDKKTGKTKGFCFLAYEDQRSTVLAVDNLNGFKLCGRTLRVDHVRQYRRPKDEDGNEIIEKGCAPKTPTPSPTPSPEPELSPPRPKKKKLKDKKKKQKDKKEKKSTHKRKRNSSPQESDKRRSLSPSSRKDTTKISRRRRESPVHKVTSERYSEKGGHGYREDHRYERSSVSDRHDRRTT